MKNSLIVLTMVMIILVSISCGSKEKMDTGIYRSTLTEDQLVIR